MNKNKYLLWAISALLLTTSSCIKDPQASNNSSNTYGKSNVAVLCEGNYLWNNAQLDIYEPDSNLVWSNAFEMVNKRPIGDVLQSGILINNTLWLVVNNSGKILALDPNTLTLKKQIDISKSPRFMTEYKGKLYISDLESNAISVFDTLTQEIKKIKVLPNSTGVRSGWSEHILVYNQKIVAAVNDGYLWVLNPSTDSVQLISTEKGAQLLSIDGQSRLWLASTENDQSILICFDRDFRVVDRYVFPAQKKVTRLKSSLTGDTLWMLVSSELYGLPVKNTSAIIKRVVPYTMGYGLGVNPINGDIYMSDAYDYIKKGRVAILNASGDSVKNSFFTGIIPSEFVFLKR